MPVQVFHCYLNLLQDHVGQILVHNKVSQACAVSDAYTDFTNGILEIGISFYQWIYCVSYHLNDCVYKHLATENKGSTYK